MPKRARRRALLRTDVSKALWRHSTPSWKRDALRQMTRNSAQSSSLSGNENEAEDDFACDIESARDSVDEFMVFSAFP